MRQPRRCDGIYRAAKEIRGVLLDPLGSSLVGQHRSGLVGKNADRRKCVFARFDHPRSALDRRKQSLVRLRASASRDRMRSVPHRGIRAIERQAAGP